MSDEMFECKPGIQVGDTIPWLGADYEVIYVDDTGWSFELRRVDDSTDGDRP